MTKTIAFQGEPGAYSHQACVETRPDCTPLPCDTFQDVIESVRKGEADLGMLAVENSTYGRVADVHQLLPESGLQIIEEAFVRVHINLLGKPGTVVGDIKTAMSHTVLLGQCRSFLSQNGIRPRTGADTAGSARIVSEQEDSSVGALASELAAKTYGLSILAHKIEDNDTNTTRFLLMGREPDLNRRGDRGMMTAFVFRVRNLPAALYKAMGGFATNGVNMTKLESYMVGGKFTATQFYAEIEGHPDDRAVQRAMEELDYFTDMVRLLGVFPQHPRRF